MPRGGSGKRTASQLDKTCDRKFTDTVRRLPDPGNSSKKQERNCQEALHEKKHAFSHQDGPAEAIKGGGWRKSQKKGETVQNPV